MTEISTITSFFGWSSIINIGLLTASSVLLILIGDKASKIHSKLFGISPEKAKLTYFQYLAVYKVAILILNVTPYIALKFLSPL